MTDYPADLQAVVNRIPEKWGKSVWCDKGWWPIVIRTDQKISELYGDYTIYQIKEKFGGLRFYCNISGEADVSDIIAEAEMVAAKTCEKCGARGDMTVTLGYWQTLCPGCMTEDSVLLEDEDDEEVEDYGTFQEAWETWEGQESEEDWF